MIADYNRELYYFSTEVAEIRSLSKKWRSPTFVVDNQFR